MAAVLVHGVPDTPVVWDDVRSHLERSDVIAPALPGFGASQPPDWTATKEAYVDWLITGIEALGQPVDLVGHDWGSLLCTRVASIRADLVRTLAVGNGPVDEAYVWHDTAQAWQTPGLGEEVMELMTPETLGPGLTEAGLTTSEATETAARVDEAMKACILTLYRSAVDVGAEWGPDVDHIEAPTLVLWAIDDPYVGARFGHRLADRVGGRLVELTGGHWWPRREAERVGAELAAHWAG